MRKMTPDDPAFVKPFRLVIQLGKFPVMERNNNGMKVKLGGSTTMSAILPDNVDVRVGDLLTLYTEVYYDDPHKN